MVIPLLFLIVPNGCMDAGLALSAGHEPCKRACKPLGGIHCCSNTATDTRYATHLSRQQGESLTIPLAFPLVQINFS